MGMMQCGRHDPYRWTVRPAIEVGDYSYRLEFVVTDNEVYIEDTDVRISYENWDDMREKLAVELRKIRKSDKMCWQTANALANGMMRHWRQIHHFIDVQPYGTQLGKWVSGSFMGAEDDKDCAFRVYKYADSHEVIKFFHTKKIPETRYQYVYFDWAVGEIHLREPTKKSEIEAAVVKIAKAIEKDDDHAKWIAKSLVSELCYCSDVKRDPQHNQILKNVVNDDNWQTQHNYQKMFGWS